MVAFFCYLTSYTFYYFLLQLTILEFLLQMLGGRLRLSQLPGLAQAAAAQLTSRTASSVSKATKADCPEAKPFYYQDMFTMETNIEPVWKQLTGKNMTAAQIFERYVTLTHHPRNCTAFCVCCFFFSKARTTFSYYP